MVIVKKGLQLYVFHTIIFFDEMTLQKYDFYSSKYKKN